MRIFVNTETSSNYARQVLRMNVEFWLDHPLGSYWTDNGVTKPNDAHTVGMRLEGYHQRCICSCGWKSADYIGDNESVRLAIANELSDHLQSDQVILDALKQDEGYTFCDTPSDLAKAFGI